MTPEPAQQPKAVKAAEIVSTEMPPVTGAPASAPAQTPAETAPQPETPKAEPLMHNGRAYDPAVYRTNPDGSLYIGPSGRPMPRGGRKPKTNALPAQPAAVSQPSFIPAEPPPPKPENGAESAPGATAPETAAPGAMPVASAKAVAECATNAGYALAGALMGDPKAARPSPAEHANLRDTAAAYIEARGLRFVGGGAVVIGIAAYLLGEERRAAIWSGIKSVVAKMRKPPPKTVTPVTDQVSPASATSRTAAPAKTEQGQPAATVSAFSGL